MRHWLAHLLHLNRGRVITLIDDDTGDQWVAFRCSTCGAIEGKRRVC